MYTKKGKFRFTYGLIIERNENLRYFVWAKKSISYFSFYTFAILLIISCIIYDSHFFSVIENINIYYFGLRLKIEPTITHVAAGSMLNIEK